MLVSRFVPLLVALALGGSVGREKTVPFTAAPCVPTPVCSSAC